MACQTKVTRLRNVQTHFNMNKDRLPSVHVQFLDDTGGDEKRCDRKISISIPF